ncbi:MAG TPA: type I-U CRISPR-associated helicase/endonuclease Cas3 [Candidatus Saccharimonadales bacterium]|nr:type I-U CRISPR-associated helicase/endonuclease Cas3 [Candidatus Saccharimonadales bacterium]
MIPLALDDFDAFFRAVHDDHEPFPWQTRLAKRLLQKTQVSSRSDDINCNNADWPQPISLPTGSGKTTCLDLAVFILAAQADLSPVQRSAARRIFYVVDRRVVVDEAFDHARQLAGMLHEAKSGILLEIAGRLRRVAGETDSEFVPLAVAQLRGGVYRDHAWARTPTQPTIVCTTVDQLGSRLLFRGYGVSAAARPIHAALAAYDSLIFLDEAHLVEPFWETLQGVRDFRKFGDARLPGSFQVVVLSATPPLGTKSSSQPFQLEAADREHPVLGPRLAAVKLATLNLAPKAKGKNFIIPLAEELVKQAIALVGETPRAIGVFANRVATARAAAKRLRDKFGDRADVLLFTGRMRPFDRDQLAEAWLPKLRPTAKLRSFAKPIFVVATQTLEVGANLDFDALITECASLDALRQRFGRLNRGGRPVESSAAIVVRADQVALAQDEIESDPVYGNALPATWLWLQDQNVGGPVDFGILALKSRLDLLTEAELSTLRLAPTHAPVMLPAHVDCWAQTAPEPYPSPDVSLFLHGPGRADADVLVCWRVDLPEDNPCLWTEILALCPPAVGECLSVPIYLIRSWLKNAKSEADTGADVPVRSTVETEDPKSQAMRFAALRWCGVEDSEVISSADELRPGNMVVLSGLAAIERDELGDFPPGSPTDVGDALQIVARARPVLRLHSAVMATWPQSPVITQLVGLISEMSSDELAACLGERDFLDELRSALALLAKEKPNGKPSWLHDSAAWLVKELGSRTRSRRSLHVHPQQGLILRSVRRMPRIASETDDFAGEDNTGSATVAVSLHHHSLGVARHARTYGSVCGLPESVQKDLEIAGWLHDLGKGDPRFQALLRGDARGGGELLAKSGGLPLSKAVRDAIAARSGYPRGGRHELLSVCLAEPLLAALPPESQDLILHLIAATHGHCRPFAPVIVDESPMVIRLRWSTGPQGSSTEGTEVSHSSATGLEHLSSGVPDRFWRLNRRHGWWGLALLEAILLLADHRTSEAEQRDSEKEPES